MIGSIFCLTTMLAGYADGEVTYRTWTTNGGQNKIEAALVDFSKGRARLQGKEKDAKPYFVPLAELAEEDRNYLQSTALPELARARYNQGSNLLDQGEYERAIAAGYENFTHLQQDPDLAQTQGSRSRETSVAGRNAPNSHEFGYR